MVSGCCFLLDGVVLFGVSGYVGYLFSWFWVPWGKHFWWFWVVWHHLGATNDSRVDFEWKSVTQNAKKFTLWEDILDPRTHQKPSNIDAKRRWEFASISVSNFVRFLSHVGVRLGFIFASCWTSFGRKAKQQKTLKTQCFSMVFKVFGDRS